MGQQRYTLGRRAIIKMILHSAKYPHAAVNGVLLGTSTGSGQLEISDAVPLFHSFHSLAPSLEVALFQVEAFAKQQGDIRIVGYYHANERFEDNELGQAARRIADTISSNYEDACALLLNNTEIQNYIQQDGAKLCELYLKNKTWSKATAVLSYADAGVPDILVDVMRENRHMQLADFEEHLEDITKDWTNPELMS